MKIFNTMERRVEEFIPIKEGEVSLYCCGPTVYNYAHIGNLRTYIFEDILKRTLSAAGYRVKHVMNITDVGHLTDDGDSGEDKIGKKARETGKSVYEIAEFYTDAFFRDIEKLNIIKPDIVCKATDNINEMIALIKRLEDKGHTYISGGNVYFSIDSIDDYGKLARLKLDELKSGARIEIDKNKKNAKDFVLWFTNSKFKDQSMVWDSPWGRGYPGWHIECSAMSMKYLGEKFDIHCGGIDAIPVHHTNEIAQSEAATGEKWVNYWMHGEFLLNDKGKMSKSSGEFLTLSSLIEKGYDPLDYRYFVLTGHYRKELKFSFDSLDQARSGRRALVDKISPLLSYEKTDRLSEKASSYLTSFSAAMEDDLKTPEAMAVFNTMLKSDIREEEKRTLLSYMDQVLGLDLEKKKKTKEAGDDELRLLEERRKAKEEKDFKRADEIREELLKRGFTLKDTPEGTIIIEKEE